MANLGDVEEARLAFDERAADQGNSAMRQAA
jgi:hypothetical protein